MSNLWCSRSAADTVVLYSADSMRNEDHAMKCLTCYYATHLVYMQHEWMSHHFIVAMNSMLEKFQLNFFVHFFLCVNWLGLIAIFSNTSFSILVLNYIMLSVFVICPLSVIIFRNGKCAVYLNSRQVYLEKKFETKNISKQTWTFDFVTAFSFLVTSILVFFSFLKILIYILDWCINTMYVQ